MEHPTGKFRTAIDALTDAVSRLNSLTDWHDWITLTAQGEGHRPDSYSFFDLRLLGNRLDIGDTSLDILNISSASGLPSVCLAASGEEYIISSLSPIETARLLDRIFRLHGKIRPFPDENDDYAVGAEW